MKNLEDPTFIFIEDHLDQINTNPNKLIERYENAMYNDNYGLLLDLLSDLTCLDAWWITEVWDELRKHEQADDAYIGRLLRVFVKRKIRQIAEYDGGQHG